MPVYAIPERDQPNMIPLFGPVKKTQTIWLLALKVLEYFADAFSQDQGLLQLSIQSNTSPDVALWRNKAIKCNVYKSVMEIQRWNPPGGVMADSDKPRNTVRLKDYS